MEKQGKASTRAKTKYNTANYDQIKIWSKKGYKDEIDEVAEALGMSRNAFILEAIEEKIKSERKKTTEA